MRRFGACSGSLERRTPRLFFDQANPEDHRAGPAPVSEPGVPTGSFCGDAWAEKRPKDEFEEIPNRLLDAFQGLHQCRLLPAAHRQVGIVRHDHLAALAFDVPLDVFAVDEVALVDAHEALVL